MHDSHWISAPGAAGPPRWVCLVGGFVVRAGGRAGPALAVGSRKARTVLAVLSVNGGRLVHVDRLIDALWTGAPPRHPAANVATLVSRLRAGLGPTAVEGDRTGYRLGAGLLVDLDHAAGLVCEAEAAMDRGAAQVALVNAAGAREVLEAGLVLTDQPDAGWGDPARVRHAELTRRARHAAAAGALGAGLTRVAVAAAEAAVRDDPFDEPAYRSLMRALVRTGEPARALMAYERLRGTLTRELGVDPAPATRALHLAILREDAAQLAVLGCPAAVP